MRLVVKFKIKLMVKILLVIFFRLLDLGGKFEFGESKSLSLRF